MATRERLLEIRGQLHGHSLVVTVKEGEMLDIVDMALSAAGAPAARCALCPHVTGCKAYRHPVTGVEIVLCSECAPGAPDGPGFVTRLTERIAAARGAPLFELPKSQG